MPESTLWLVKDSNDVVSHCACPRAISGDLPQLDCPWCGCGWLFACAECGKSFMFARVERVPESRTALARRLHREAFGEDPEPEELADAVQHFEALVDGYKEGDRVVVLDGVILPADGGQPISLEGLFASHEFDELPHVLARTNPGILQETLASEEYWLERRLPDEDDED